MDSQNELHAVGEAVAPISTCLVPGKSYFRLKWTYDDGQRGLLDGKPYVFIVLTMKPGTSDYKIPLDPAEELGRRDDVQRIGWPAYVAEDGTYLGRRFLYRGGPIQAFVLALDTDDEQEIVTRVNDAQRVLDEVDPYLHYAGAPAALAGPVVSAALDKAGNLATTLIRLAGDDVLARGYRVLVNVNGGVLPTGGQWTPDCGATCIRLDVEPDESTYTDQVDEVRDWLKRISDFVDNNHDRKDFAASSMEDVQRLADEYDRIREVLNSDDRQKTLVEAFRQITKLVVGEHDATTQERFQMFVRRFRERLLRHNDFEALPPDLDPKLDLASAPQPNVVPLQPRPPRTQIKEKLLYVSTKDDSQARSHGTFSHSDTTRIAIPSGWEYVNHWTECTTDAGANLVNVSLEQANGRVVGVTMRISVESRALFGKNNFRGERLKVTLREVR